jgi:cytochrome c2
MYYRLSAVIVAALLLGSCGEDPKFTAGELVPGGDPARGRALIIHFGCPSCHTIPGVNGADGLVGPPLTKIALRTYLAGRIANTPENMAGWIVNPKSVDEKTAMPVTGVSPDEVRHIVRYLYTLR